MKEKNTNTYSVPCIYPKLQEHTALSNQGHNTEAGTNQQPADFENAPSSAAPLTVQVPGSKSITNRALLLSTLAEGTSTLKGVLFSDDSRHFLKCVQDLGFETTVDEEAKVITVTGHGGKVPLTEASQYVGSAGTAARFLTAYLGVSNGTYHMDASQQMRRRPMAPLLNSLKELGCEVIYTESASCSDKGNMVTTKTASAAPVGTHSTTAGREGFFPFTLKSHGFGQNHITINIDHSSQFLSALLIASCLSEKDFTVEIEGSHGMAYIEMTRKMMAQFGVQADMPTASSFLTKAGQTYLALDYQIEPDVSAACYFYAFVPLLHIPVLVEHVHFDSLQGDVQFIHILEQMGCTAEDTPQGILLKPPATQDFPGITVDMSACSDQAITLAAIAPFASSPTTITGIGHIRFQESNRIQAICTELTRMGIRCEEGGDSITIYPGTPSPAVIQTYDDHRMAMGFSLVGLRSEGIIINDPGCCRKTFENYFEVLEHVITTLAG